MRKPKNKYIYYFYKPLRECDGTYSCPDCGREYLLFNKDLQKRMCIYFGRKENLTYTSQEHVLPAGLGCHTKLPMGTVSDQANKYFSPIERRVLEQSLVQLNRIIEGPGKRGSLSPSKATTSEVSVIELNGNVGLGYMKGMNGFILNHFIIDFDDENSNSQSGVDGVKRIRYCQGNEKEIPDSENEYSELYKSDMRSLKDKLSKWDDYYKYLPLDAESVFVTFFKGRIYVAAKEEPSDGQIKKLKEVFKRDFGYGNSVKDAGELKLTLEVKHGFVDVAKVAAKTAINTLCYLKGSEAICDAADLDMIKDKIFSDDDSILYNVIEIPDAREIKRKKQLDDDVHACLLYKSERTLKAYVIFYDRCFDVTLSRDSSVDVNIVDGIVCKWKEMRDLTYHEYLTEKGMMTQP